MKEFSVEYIGRRKGFDYLVGHNRRNNDCR
jgi:hypothetical protein